MTPPPTDFSALIRALNKHQVEYLVVGGFAGNVHGITRVTYDLDILYSRSASNLKHLAAALVSFRPYLRDIPPGLPFVWDEVTLSRGLTFTLTTTAGDLDLLGELLGVGSYDDAVSRAVTVQLFGETVRCLGRDDLIRSKRAAGRPKDLETIAQLEAMEEDNDASR